MDAGTKFSMKELFQDYLAKTKDVTEAFDWATLEPVVELLLNAVHCKKQVFIMGNGGSAANAVHIANDYIYGINPGGQALNIEALSANQAVLTCLGNDIGYESIFAHQIKVKASEGDIVIVLSGSGNSENIVRAIIQAKDSGCGTMAILGYDGGKVKNMVSHPIHFSVADMQISEDLQLVVGHMLMQAVKKELENV